MSRTHKFVTWIPGGFAAGIALVLTASAVSDRLRSIVEPIISFLLQNWILAVIIAVLAAIIWYFTWHLTNQEGILAMTSNGEKKGIFNYGSNYGQQNYHEAPKQRTLTPEFKAEILDAIPKDRKVSVDAMMGDPESITFATEILIFLRDNGFDIESTMPNQVIFGHPVRGIIFEEDKNRIVIGFPQAT